MQSEETSKVTPEIIARAESMGLVPSPDIEALFYLVTTPYSEEELQGKREELESNGFFFNGVGATPDGEPAVEFVCK